MQRKVYGCFFSAWSVCVLRLWQWEELALSWESWLRGRLSDGRQTCSVQSLHSWSCFWTSVFIRDFFSNCSSFYFFLLSGFHTHFWDFKVLGVSQAARCWHLTQSVWHPCKETPHSDAKQLRSSSFKQLPGCSVGSLTIRSVFSPSFPFSSGRVGLIQVEMEMKFVSLLVHAGMTFLFTLNFLKIFVHFFFYSCQNCVWFSLIRGCSYVDALYMWNNKRIKSRSWTLIFSASVESFYTYKTTVVVLLKHLKMSLYSAVITTAE